MEMLNDIAQFASASKFIVHGPFDVYIVTAIYTDLLMMDTINIAPEFEGAASIGILQIDGLLVQESPEELKAMLNRIAGDYAAKYKDQPLGEIPTVRKIRAIFHRAGLDPTRYRPSSESLLRRAVKGKGLYFI